MRFAPGAAIAPFLLASLLVVPASPVRADVYRWTDEQGVIHFTDSPENVPARYRAAREKPAEGGEATAKPEPSPEAPAAQTQAAVKPEAEGASGDRQEPAGAPEASPYQDAATASGAALDNFGRDETWWRDRKKFWEQRLADSQRLYDETRREFNRVNQRYDNREYKQMKQLREQMDTLEKEIAKAQEMLGGGLAREARKAGAPPGWIR